eukprot:6094567-Pyramimonas_sp.AAC.1
MEANRIPMGTYIEFLWMPIEFLWSPIEFRWGAIELLWRPIEFRWGGCRIPTEAYPMQAYKIPMEA